jgi:hypothetical protein
VTATDWDALKRKRPDGNAAPRAREGAPSKDGRPSPALMPRSMSRIAAVIGEEKAFELVSKLGGTMVYVAATAQPDTLLVQAVGAAAAQKLAKDFAGTHLSLPVAGRAVTLWLKSRGLSNNEIARIQRVSAHTVARRLGRQDQDQLDLFQSPR